MSSPPVHTGFWRDFSYSGGYGWCLTLSEENGRYLLTGTATFITAFVATISWSGLVAYGVHQFCVPCKGKAVEPLRYQHQVAFRNSQSAISTALDLLFLWAALRPSNILREDRPRKKGTLSPTHPQVINKRRYRSSTGRTAMMILWPLGTWISFTASSILSARVARSNPAFAKNDVRIRYTKNRCGLINYNGTTLQTELAYNNKMLHDTIAARAYARSCYAGDLDTSYTIACNFFTKPSLRYKAVFLDQSCPFGKSGSAANLNIAYKGGDCDTASNTGSHFMYTDVLDSHFDLGINAPPGNRIQFQKNTTCSPLVIHTAKNAGDFGRGNYTAYMYGPFPGLSQEYTYLYQPQAIYDNVGYQMTAVYYLSGSQHNAWKPTANLTRADGDTTLIFFSANSVRYYNQTLDPFFLANNYLDEPEGPMYYASNSVSVLGCVDQYALRNPTNEKRSFPGGLFSLSGAMESIGFNAAQRVTAQRLLIALNSTDTYSSVFGSGPAALKASDKVLNFASDVIQYGQWRVEVEGWFQTGLAKLQQATVDYAYNTADLGQYAYLAVPTALDSGENTTWNDQCGEQKISNTGGYESFWVLGLVVIIVVGLTLVSLGLTLKKCIACSRRRKVQSGLEDQNVRQYAYVADNKFQLQRMVLEKATDGPRWQWGDRDTDYPWCIPEDSLDLKSGGFIAVLEEDRSDEPTKNNAVYYRPWSTCPENRLSPDLPCETSSTRLAPQTPQETSSETTSRLDQAESFSGSVSGVQVEVSCGDSTQEEQEDEQGEGVGEYRLSALPQGQINTSAEHSSSHYAYVPD